jgi:hypothetical protein
MCVCVCVRVRVCVRACGSKMAELYNDDYYEQARPCSALLPAARSSSVGEPDLLQTMA